LALWRNNDLWNLLPADSKVNGNKSDYLPSPELVRKRFDMIKSYWEIYIENYEDLFSKQIKRALGVSIEDAFNRNGLEALEHSLTRLNVHQGGLFWKLKSK